MKKGLLSLAAMLGIAGLAYAGNGTQASPYTVDEVIALGTSTSLTTDTGIDDVYVQGYIVGYMPTAGSTVLKNTVFSATGDVANTNMVLSGSSAEDDYTYCIGIQLPSGKVRNGLNLASNPQNLGHEVILHGNIRMYCGSTGLKDVNSYEWVGEAPEEGPASNALLSSSLGDFTIENALALPAGVPFVWEWSDQYNCAKATGYIDGQSYATDSYLVSPEIALGDVTTATIEQALNYLRGGVMDENIGIYVREGATGAWQQVSYNNPPSGDEFKFVTSQIDLAAYKGKSIQIGFRYRSTDAAGTTWEIKNLVIGGTATGGGNTPSEPTATMTVAEGIAWLNAGNSGNATVKGYITSIKEVSTDYGNATYYIGDSASDSNTITVYRGYYLNGEKFTSAGQIKVGDLVVVTGNLELYGNYKEPEFTSGNKILSINEEGGNAGGGDTPSTPAEEMTVAEGIAWLNAGNSGNATVKGYITSIKEVNTDYGNATYYIGDSTSDTNTITVYRGYYLNGEKFTSAGQIKVGDVVVVTGNLELYGNYKEPEFTSGNKILSINGEGGGGNNPGGGDTPSQPSGESVTFDFTVPSSLGAGFSDAGEGGQEVDITGMTLTSGVVSLTFANNGTSTSPRLYYGSGNAAGWTMRFYKDNVITVEVADNYVLTGIEFNGTNIGTNWSCSNGSIASSVWTPSTATAKVEIGKTATGNNPSIKTMKVYYADNSGVEEVLAADDAEAVYFNLQGQKVENPERGIFIKVVAGKAVKVVK